MTDEEEAELDDLDEDENKDVRMTEHRWDKNIENGAEFDVSDDDEMAAANGATRQNGNKRSFNDFRNEDTAEETDSKASPKRSADDGKDADAADVTAHDVNDDTIEDVAATEEHEAAASKEADSGDAKKQRVDADGDVGMDDSTPALEKVIKMEDGENDTAVQEAAKEPEKATEDAAAKEEEPKDDAAKAAEAEAPLDDAAGEADKANADKAPEAAAEAEAEAMEVDDKEKSGKDTTEES